MRKCVGAVVGLVVVSALLAGCGSDKPDERTREGGIAAIEKLGGVFSEGGKMLDLDLTEVTDAGLVHLKGMARRVQLRLGGTKVTDAGVAKLKAALPKCRIVR